MFTALDIETGSLCSASIRRVRYWLPHAPVTAGEDCELQPSRRICETVLFDAPHSFAIWFTQPLRKLALRNLSAAARVGVCAAAPMYCFRLGSQKVGRSRPSEVYDRESAD